MTTYRIRGWDEHYETYESRRLKRALPWVAMSTKHDGKSFRRVMRLDPSGALYGAWCLIVQVAAKCPKRGTLADADGPLSALDIADKTDLSVETAGRALAAFSSEKIHWLEIVDGGESAGICGQSDESAGIPADALPTCVDARLQDTTEPDRTEPDITQQDKDTMRRKRGGGDAVTVQAVVDAWNNFEGVRHVRGIAGKRGMAIKARLSDPDWRDNWQAALERIRRSSFCKGGGDRGWVADLDWFIKPDTVTKLLEGKFDDAPSKSNGKANGGSHLLDNLQRFAESDSGGTP